MRRRAPNPVNQAPISARAAPRSGARARAEATEPQWISVFELARRFGVSVSLIRKHERIGLLQVERIGAAVRIPVANLPVYQARLKAMEGERLAKLRDPVRLADIKKRAAETIQRKKREADRRQRRSATSG